LTRERSRRASVIGAAAEGAYSKGDEPFQKLQGLAREGRAEAAEDALYELIDAGVRPQSSHFNLVIDACAAGKDIERAGRWLFRMQALEVAPDVHTYHSLLGVALEATDTSAAQRWLGDAEDAGIQPDVQTYRLVLKTLGRAGRQDLVEVWLEEMMNKGTHPDTGCCNAVIRAFAENGNMKKVEEWLVVMERSLGLPHDVETYNTAIAGYTALGDFDSAERLMQHMADRGVEPDVVTYLHLIGSGKTFFRNASAVRRWSDELRSSGLELDENALTTVVNALSAAGDMDKAEEWFARMVEEGRPTAEALASVVDALVLYGGSQGMETAQEWVDQVRRLGIALTPAVYAALSSVDVMDGDFEQVEARMQQMEVDGVRMNADSLAALLLAYANAEPQQSQLAEQVFKQQMMRGRVEATRDVLEALRSAVGGSRCLALRRELMLSKSPDPSSTGTSASGGTAWRRKTKSKQWSSFSKHEVKEKTIAWE